MSEYAIDIQHITKTYNMYKKSRPIGLKRRLVQPKNPTTICFYALDDVTMQIKKGEMIGFVGENGSGKSTMLKKLLQEY